MVFLLSTSRITMEFTTAPMLNITAFGLRNASWLNWSSFSEIFRVQTESGSFRWQQGEFRDFQVEARGEGIIHAVARFSNADFLIHLHLQMYQESALVEMWQTVRALSTSAPPITRLDSFLLAIPKANYRLLSFSSDWGQEFEPVSAPLKGTVTLESQTGRSSKGQHPWFALFQGAESVLSASIAWSGNWIFRFVPLLNGGYHISGGLHDVNFSKTLRSGELIETPHAILALGHDLDDTAQQYTRVGRRYWYPRNQLSASLPVEWNHWWSYEDADINEDVFLANVEAAAALGIELCTLDAGWFGTNEHWYQLRGDWDHVNTERFPHGIRAISDAVHAKGMKFGLWCEIEGLGEQAQLAQTHPDFVAQRDGVSSAMSASAIRRPKNGHMQP